MAWRFAFSTAAVILFLALFITQLINQHGPIKKSYASTTSVSTPCSAHTNVCPPLETIYSPADVPLGTSFLAYNDSRWPTYYSEWDGLCDKQCNCSNTVHYSRWYAFDTDFPCTDFVGLCVKNASMTSQAFADAVLSPVATCFPEPVSNMSGAGMLLVTQGNKVNTLQDFNITDATRDMVKVAGNKFCMLLKNMPVIEAPTLLPVLMSKEVLHMNAVKALSSNLNVLTTTALFAALTAEAKDADSAYIRQYLNWHSSRVVNQAFSEVQVGDKSPWRKSSAYTSSAYKGVPVKPLLLPLKVQKACLDMGNCNITIFLNSTPHLVWHFDMFDWASYTCRPTECIIAVPGTKFDILANVMSLFGSLLNAVIFAGLPFVWALIGWMFFGGFESNPQPPAAAEGQVRPTHPGCLSIATPAVRGIQTCARHCFLSAHEPDLHCRALIGACVT